MSLKLEESARWEEAGAQRIGGVTTEAEFVASMYGDYRLFFKHSDRFIREDKKSP